MEFAPLVAELYEYPLLYSMVGQTLNQYVPGARLILSPLIRTSYSIFPLELVLPVAIKDAVPLPDATTVPPFSAETPDLIS